MERDVPPLPAADLLSDELVELRLIRVMGVQGSPARPPEQKFLEDIPEFRFAIHRRSDDTRIGRIHLRVTENDRIVKMIGHCGYAVDEAHRRRGYATHAIRLIVELARHWKLMPLWILIEPGNVASRGAVEKAGFHCVDEVDSSDELQAMGVGKRVCRYSIVE